MLCVFTNRGRYDIKIYPTFLQLHGKTFDYKIAFTSILRLFLLPHRDGRQMFFVVSRCSVALILRMLEEFQVVRFLCCIVMTFSLSCR